MTKNRNGFTLVELGIVLVIVGLLIGGILVGQSMITTAKINSFLRQVQQYDAGTSNFQEQFKQFPGDSNLFVPAGNNNGRAGTDAVAGGVGVCGVASCFEYFSYWKHLSDSGMIKDIYTNDLSAGFAPGRNLPKIELSKAMLVGGVYNAADGVLTGAQGHNYMTNGAVATALPTSGDTFAVETKIDDRVMTTGNVRSYNTTDFTACAMSYRNCMIIISIGHTLGKPM